MVLSRLALGQLLVLVMHNRLPAEAVSRRSPRAAPL